MKNQTVLYEKSENIVTITYNRPDKQNAINGQMRKELNAAWDEFNEDETAWVAILTGSGTTFCGGADLRDASGSTGRGADLLIIDDPHSEQDALSPNAMENAHLKSDTVTHKNKFYCFFKFKANPEILILHVVNIIPTNFQSKILSPGLLPAI